MPLIPAHSEIEIKGVHFKICNPGVAECKLNIPYNSLECFTIYDYQPHHKLKDLKQIIMTPLIKNAEVLNFYFTGIRLRDMLKLRDLQHMH